MTTHQTQRPDKDSTRDAIARSLTALPVRRMIDVTALAKKLGCDPRTVYRLADGGKSPPGVKLGALRRWDEVEIDAWIAGGCKPVRVGRGNK